MKLRAMALLLGTAAMLAGCTTVPDDALVPCETLLADRAMQSRKYETVDEAHILSACVGVLQDLGFVIEETETGLGYLGGSKMRSAVDAKMEVLKWVTLVLAQSYMPTDKEQKFRASVCTRPSGEDHVAVRVTFQRIVWNELEQVTRREPLKDPEIYQEFFDRLSKAIFLEAQQL